MSDTKRLLRYAEAAEYLGMSVRQLRTAVNKRRIDFIKPSGESGPTYFDRADLDRFITKCRQPALHGLAARRTPAQASA